MKNKIFVLICVLLIALPIVMAEKKIHLQSREFVPDKKVDVEQNPQRTITSVFTNQKKHILLQLDHIPTEQEKQDFSEYELTFLEYIPDHAWIISIPSSKINELEQHEDVIFIGDLKKQDKLLHSLETRSKSGNFLNKVKKNKIKLQGYFFSDVSDQNSILSKYTDDYNLANNKFIINISKNQLNILASEDSIKWVTDVFPIKVTHNNNARNVSGVQLIQAHPYNLTGDGVVAAEWDQGWAGNHTDLHERVTIGDSGSSVQDHATHVAGTMLGNGTTNSLYKGMAPKSTLITHEWFDDVNEFNTEYSAAINTYDAVVSQNSWGFSPSPISDANCGAVLGNYFTDNIWVDNATRGSQGKEITIVWSAGNQRSSGASYCGSIGYTYNTSTPMGTSKNTITVGAVGDDESMASFSSWGPTDDGRIKPDVVANGVGVTSTIPNASTTYTPPYFSLSGTSMAAPVVSGIVLLLYEHYKSLNNNNNPKSSLIKALLIHTAKDLNTTGPDFYNGWGLVNATSAVDYITNNSNKTIFFSENITSTGNSTTYYFELPENKSELKITLVWNDYPGSVSISKQLINDLDIIVTNSSGARFYPWTLDSGNPSNSAVQTQIDDINNVEQVYISNPNQGIYTVVVNGSAIPYPNQEFSLITTTSDDVAPYIIISSPQNGSTYKNPVVLNYSVIDSHTQSCWFTNTSNQNQTLPSCNNISLTIPSDGSYNLTVYANDSYSNINYSIVFFDADITGPNITFADPSKENVTSLNISVEINVSIVDLSNNISSCLLEWNYTNESMTISGMGSNMSCYKNKSITGSGVFYYKVWANDSVNNWGSSQIRYFNLTNTAPNITSYTPNISTISVAENSSIQFNHTSIDINNDNLTYNWTLNLSTQSTNSSWLYQPDFTESGIYNVTLFVNDEKATISQSWNLTVNNTNNAPVILTYYPNNTNISVAEPDSQIFNITTSDADNETILISWLKNSTLVSNSSNYTFTGNYTSTGYYNITVIINDSTETDSITWLLTINNTNIAPVLNNLSNITVNESGLVNINSSGDLNATNPDMDNLTFNYTSPLNSSGMWRTNYKSSGTYITTVTVSDGSLTDSQNVTITVLEVEDNDNDGINDSSDYVLGNSSSINTTLTNLSLSINGSTNITKIFNGSFTVNITNGTHKIIEFNWTFSENSTFNLSNITINKQENTSILGSMIVRGLSLASQNNTKIIYVDDINNSTDSVCVKDAEIGSISDINNGCSGTNETGVVCNGTSYNGYTCTDLGAQYKITNLSHSGVIEQCIEVWGCGDWGGCSSSSQSRICTDSKSCGTTYNKPSITQSCNSGTSGGGGGGGSSYSSSSDTKETKQWYKIEQGETKTMSIEKEKISFKNISISLNEKAYNVKLTVERLSKKPEGFKEPVAGAYQYLVVNKSNIENENIMKINITFNVNKSWASENNIKKEEIILMKYVSDNWKELLTYYATEDDDNFYYSSIMGTLSYFTISAKKHKIIVPIIEVNESFELPLIQQENITYNQTNTTQEEAISEEQNQFLTYPWWIYTAAGSLIILILAGVFFYFKKNKKSEEEEKQEELEEDDYL
ncbi:S8 family serine peptidase [Candidatus Woesearchaeota archaeon]|nr:S8 family serine peptidase [Candidatus Woesearchaeota archaeon]